VAYRQHAVGDPGVHGARAVSSDAYDRDTGASPRHGGAPRGSEDWDGSEDLDFDGLLDRDCLGVRGERPASRRELAELLLRYRDEQASRQSRRKKEETARPRFSPEQRLLILDAWLRSKLPAGDFAPLVGISLHTLRAWKARFAELGPAGLDDKPLGRPAGSRLSEATKRAILLMKEEHRDWGQDRIAAMLLRAQGFQASASAVGRVLEEGGYVAAPDVSKPHAQEPKRFERARANQLWQTDLFTFVLKRENRRVHMVAFLDDHSRFVVGFGLHATASGALVRETLMAAIANFSAPEEVLTDNGTQYVTWRGKSEFQKLLEQRGIQQIVATPRHPETLGKIERFWGTLWRECVETAVFRGLDDARRRIGLFIDHYNFQRPHSGCEGLVPADRYFAAAPQVLQTLKARVAKNAAELARDGMPRKPFYLTGRIGDQSISLHAEGEKVVLTKGDGSREEVDLGATGPRPQAEAPAESLPEPVVPMGNPPDHVATADEAEPAPGASPLDDFTDLLGEEGGR
ncbi:MAG: DDE-type integrase/transposase/recombinase, partial [Planctomycetes bacterium]|nr:DDE-type integrase/transposase/recombinase [Planctomycetota bacterium]